MISQIRAQVANLPISRNAVNTKEQDLNFCQDQFWRYWVKLIYSSLDTEFISTTRAGWCDVGTTPLEKGMVAEEHIRAGAAGPHPP